MFLKNYGMSFLGKEGSTERDMRRGDENIVFIGDVFNGCSLIIIFTRLSLKMNVQSCNECIALAQRILNGSSSTSNCLTGPKYTKVLVFALERDKCPFQEQIFTRK